MDMELRSSCSFCAIRPAIWGLRARPATACSRALPFLKPALADRAASRNTFFSFS